MDLIPEFQPIPFPGPLWLLKGLLILGFFLHAVPMNVALMGGLVSAVFLWVGLNKNHVYAARIGNALGASLPFFVSFAITMGVVPLLFLQLTYGTMFFTSSILIAVPWLMVIFLLMVGYYGYYVFTYQRVKLVARGPWLLVGVAVLFMAIAFFFTNNMTLMLTPERWMPLYQASPHGLSLNWGEPQLIPRYLHFVVAAIAVVGLTMGCFGLYWRNRDPEYGRWLIRTGAVIYILPTLLQFFIGVWFLLSLPQNVMMNLLGGDAWGTGVFVSSMVLDIGALIAMTLAWKSASPRPFSVGLVLALGLILLMVILRHLVRTYFIEDLVRPDLVPVDPQWLLIGLFGFFLLLTLVYMAWLVKITWQAFHAPVQDGGATL